MQESNEREKEGAKKLRYCRKEKESKLWFLCFFFGTTKLMNSNTNIVCIATSIARLVSRRVRKKLFHLYYLSLLNPLKSNNIDIIFNEHLLDIHWDVRDGMSCNVRDFFFFFFTSWTWVDSFCCFLWFMEKGFFGNLRGSGHVIWTRVVVTVLVTHWVGGWSVGPTFNISVLDSTKTSVKVNYNPILQVV